MDDRRIGVWFPAGPTNFWHLHSVETSLRSSPSLLTNQYVAGSSFLGVKAALVWSYPSRPLVSSFTVLGTIVRLPYISLRGAYLNTRTFLSLPLIRSVNIRCRIVNEHSYVVAKGLKYPVMLALWSLLGLHVITVLYNTGCFRRNGK
jgi:hypothetical protein